MHKKSLLEEIEENLTVPKNLKDYDLDVQNREGNTALTYLLKNHILLKTPVAVNDWEYLIKHSNLKLCNKENESALSLLFSYNKDIKMKPHLMNYLIENSNLNELDNMQRVPLVYALMNNKTERLNLSNKQWKYLIDNTDLSYTTKNGRSLFIYYLSYKKMQKIKISNALVEKIFNACLNAETKEGASIFVYLSIYHKAYAADISPTMWQALVNEELNQTQFISILATLENAIQEKNGFFEKFWKYTSEKTQKKIIDTVIKLESLNNLRNSDIIKTRLERDKIESIILPTNNKKVIKKI